ncbi:UNVERIFIED_CONTAM: hypothetical protein K2H54_018447 [Gekko kuhli]
MRRTRSASRHWGCCFCGARVGGGGGGGACCGSASSARRGRGEAGERCVCGGWRGRAGGSPQQLAERYADLAASHADALRLGEERERQSGRLREENARLKLENRRLRRENRSLFRQVLKLQQEPLPPPLARPLPEREARPEGRCLSGEEEEEGMLRDPLAEKGHEPGTEAEEGRQGCLGGGEEEAAAQLGQLTVRRRSAPPRLFSLRGGQRGGGGEMLCGGVSSQAKAATAEIQELVQAVKAEVEEKEGRNFELFNALEYKTQTVAGINYFIKVQTGNDQYLHIRIHKSLPHENKPPALASYQSNKEKHEELSYF